MLYAIVSSLLVSSAFAACQYAMYADPVLDTYIPVGIGKCHAYATDSSEVSVKFTCTSATELTMDTYASYDCSGTGVTTTYTSSSWIFDCSTSGTQCGTEFGYSVPCNCDAANGGCDHAASYYIVTDTCVPLSGLSQKWAISCSGNSGSFSTYQDSTCTTVLFEGQFEAGCKTNADYTEDFGSEQVEWTVCGNESSAFGITSVKALLFGLLVALVVA